MKTLLFAALATLLSVGSVVTQDANAQSHRVTVPAPGGQRGFDDGDNGCEEIGSNMTECWTCEEDQAGAQTICDSWVETDDGEEIFRESSPNTQLESKP